MKTPQFAWGGWRITGSHQTHTPEALIKFLIQIHELGIEWIDLADIYDDGACEALVGQALALEPGLEKQFRIISKCGVRFPSPGQPGVKVAHYRSDPDYIRSHLNASLERLKRDSVDYLLLHRPDYLMDAEATGSTLDDLVQSKTIGAAGISNFSVSQLQLLQQAMDTSLGSHQIEYSPLHSQPLDDGTLDYAQSHNQIIFAWSPLAQGRIFGDEEDAIRVRGCLETICGSDDSDQIAGGALAWVGHHAADIIPILGTTRIERLKTQLETARSISLDVQDWYQVLESSRGAKVP